MIASKSFLWFPIITFINSVKSNSLAGSQCSLKTNGKGVCTNYRNCSYFINKLKNHEIEFKDVDFCDSYGLVCCPSNLPELRPILLSSPRPILFSPPRPIVTSRISEESKFVDHLGLFFIENII